MALASDTPAGQRIYQPNFGRWYPRMRERSEERSRLLRRIHDSYRQALQRLNVRVRSGMAACFVLGGGGGLCLGFLDPVSNIVANAVISYGRRGGAGSAAERDDDGLVYVPEAELRDLERRSLDGMVAFLTRFFPYLAECEAVRFLLFADADLLVAVRIAASDLGMRRFGESYSEPAATNEVVEMALTCAALAAEHPNPDRLVGDWITISTRLDETVRLLAEVRRRSDSSSLRTLAKVLDGTPLPAVHQDHRRLIMAASRGPPPHSVPPYQSTIPLKETLQDAIHGFYLLPAARRRAALPLPPQPA